MYLACASLWYAKSFSLVPDCKTYRTVEFCLLVVDALNAFVTKRLQSWNTKTDPLPEIHCKNMV